MPKVMIVAKSEKSIWLAKKLLSEINFEIEFETGNGYEAIEKYDVVKPDLLLLNLHLSNNDGIMVLKEIKKTHPESKIVIITAAHDEKLFEDCMNLGALKCMSLPFNLKDFVTLVTSINYATTEQSPKTPLIKEN